MAKPRQIDLPDGTIIPILYEDRSVLAIDKPAGWLLVPSDWEETSRNLQRALESGINGGEFWARSRNLKFLRFVHRLDAGTSGVLLLVKSPGAVGAYSKLFEGREVQKTYLAIVKGIPKQKEWTCKESIEPDPGRRGRMRVARSRNRAEAKEAETSFRVVQSGADSALVEARPLTGRTHQIRVHLLAAGHPVLGDVEYASSIQIPGGARGVRALPAEAPKLASHRSDTDLALRAIAVAYRDPFTGERVRIEAPWRNFSAKYGFKMNSLDVPNVKGSDKG
jgi:RluA family pseudouridine synthase